MGKGLTLARKISFSLEDRPCFTELKYVFGLDISWWGGGGRAAISAIQFTKSNISKGSRKKSYFMGGSAFKAPPPPLSLMAVGAWQKKLQKNYFLLMASPIPPPPSLNGTAIKKAYFFLRIS